MRFLTYTKKSAVKMYLNQLFEHNYYDDIMPAVKLTVLLL